MDCIEYIIWAIAGIFMLAIALFVHLHTYIVFKEKRVPLYTWMVLLAIAIALFPILNLIAFIVGIAMYLISLDEDIIFKSDDSVICKCLTANLIGD